MGLRAQVTTAILAVQTKQVAGDEYALHPVRKSILQEIASSGVTGATVATKVGHLTGTIPTGTNLDLVGDRELVDAFGDPLVLSDVCAIFIRHVSSVTNADHPTLNVSGNLGGVDLAVMLPPGATVLYCTPNPTDAGTGWITLGNGTSIEDPETPSGSDITYEVIVIGS